MAASSDDSLLCSRKKLKCVCLTACWKFECSLEVNGSVSDVNGSQPSMLCSAGTVVKVWSIYQLYVFVFGGKVKHVTGSGRAREIRDEVFPRCWTGPKNKCRNHMFDRFHTSEVCMCHSDTGTVSQHTVQSEYITTTCVFIVWTPGLKELLWRFWFNYCFMYLTDLKEQKHCDSIHKVLTF